jgi:hypothetical protein
MLNPYNINVVPDDTACQPCEKALPIKNTSNKVRLKVEFFMLPVFD